MHSNPKLTWNERLVLIKHGNFSSTNHSKRIWNAVTATSFMYFIIFFFFLSKWENRLVLFLTHKVTGRHWLRESIDVKKWNLPHQKEWKLILFTILTNPANPELHESPKDYILFCPVCHQLCLGKFNTSFLTLSSILSYRIAPASQADFNTSITVHKYLYIIAFLVWLSN